MKQLQKCIIHMNGMLLAALISSQALGLFTSTANAQQASRLIFARPVFTVIENLEERATITVTRIGDTSATASVTYATSDTTPFVRCDTQTGTASERCDYATTIDTLRFAPGETSKTFTVPIIGDTHSEGTEELTLTLSNPVGAELGLINTARLLIFDNGITFSTGPFDPPNQTRFFVRQHYLDFLSREPEPQGFADWTSVLNRCPNVNDDPACDRVAVSAAFFTSDEFQFKGYFVYRFYKATLGRLPHYAEIIPDMRRVTGTTGEEVAAKRDQFAREWLERDEFRSMYGGTTNEQFVDKLLQPINVQQITVAGTSLTREGLVSQLDSQAKTRVEMVRQIVESKEVDQREYNGAFVAMQYFGYLRRDPESEGYQAWLEFIDRNPQDSRTMVGGFVNSVEYKLRFGRP